jgi:hypothetical protein
MRPVGARGGVTVVAKLTNKQVIRVRHQKRDVFLVGTMHYNPVSIAKARETVTDLNNQGKLGALVLETCPTRWQKTLSFQPPGSFMHALLMNEFQSASEAAPDVVPILGDMRIEDLGGKLKTSLKETTLDILIPTRWQSYRADVESAIDGEIKAANDEGVTELGDIFDIRLLANVPVSLFRYPLAWMLKSPALMVPFATFWLTIAALPGIVESIPDTAQQTTAENVVTDVFLALDILQISLLTKCFLGVLLRDRNDILAKSISDACEGIDEEQSVVAILGAAHLNGVHRRLL